MQFIVLLGPCADTHDFSFRWAQARGEAAAVVHGSMDGKSKAAALQELLRSSNGIIMLFDFKFRFGSNMPVPLHPCLGTSRLADKTSKLRRSAPRLQAGG